MVENNRRTCNVRERTVRKYSECNATASFATHSSDMKSHTGVYITLGNGAIHCRSSKEKLVTKSSTTDVGISDELPLIIWFKHFIEAQGHPPLPAHIREDNQSTICLTKKGQIMQ